MVISLESLILSSSLSINKDKFLVSLLIAEVVMSIVTLLAYKIDKTKAKKGKWRTKEKTLLIKSSDKNKIEEIISKLTK